MSTILKGLSPYNKFLAIDEQLTRNQRKVYVDLTGSDADGDGSQAKPFATIVRAMQELTGTTRFLLIELGAGEHDCPYLYVLDAVVRFEGAGVINFTSGSNWALAVEVGYVLFTNAGLKSTKTYNGMIRVITNSVVYFDCSVGLSGSVSAVFDSAFGGNVVVATGANISKTGTSIPLVTGIATSTQLINSTLTNVTN